MYMCRMLWDEVPMFRILNTCRKLLGDEEVAFTVTERIQFRSIEEQQKNGPLYADMSLSRRMAVVGLRLAAQSQVLQACDNGLEVLGEDNNELQVLLRRWETGESDSQPPVVYMMSWEALTGPVKDRRYRKGVNAFADFWSGLIRQEDIRREDMKQCVYGGIVIFFNLSGASTRMTVERAGSLYIGFAVESTKVKKQLTRTCIVVLNTTV